MLFWSENFPQWKYPLGYARLRAANLRLRRRIGLKRGGFGLKLGAIDGDADRLEALRNRYEGQRCFVLGNGPSLAQTPVDRLRSDVTIGANGVYRAFSDWGFATTFLLFEDVEQTEQRGSEIGAIEGPIKIAAAHNAHAIPRPWRDLIFMNARFADDAYWRDVGIQFSRDFPHIVYLGSTITYIGLQLAYHLGCNPVYLVGVDFDYGPLEALFPPGKVKIGEAEMALVRQTHFSDDYYKLGDVIGVPNTAYQEAAFRTARDAFEADGRVIYNATLGGKLDVFDRAAFSDLFSEER